MVTRDAWWCRWIGTVPETLGRRQVNGAAAKRQKKQGKRSDEARRSSGLKARGRCAGLKGWGLHNSGLHTVGKAAALIVLHLETEPEEEERSGTRA